MAPSYNYLDNIKILFKYYKNLEDKTLEQVTKTQVFHQINQGSNSIATIIKHLGGNMLSR